MSPQPNAIPKQSRIVTADEHESTTILVDRSFPATDIYVRLMVSHVIDMLCKCEIKPDFQFTVEIVLAELLNNIVEHGYAGKMSGDIKLRVFLVADKLHVETVDHGLRMPGLTVPKSRAHNLDVDRAQLPEGQFGWFLIRKLSEDLNYQRIGKTNKMTLTIRQ